LRAGELTRERVEDARSVLKEGEELEAKFIGVDRKKRVISLSLKAKESEEEENTIQEYNRSQPSMGATLGDLIKEQLENKE
jgi:small subunit ribosomal protein S1